MGPYGDLMKTWRPKIEAGERIPPSLIENPEPEIWIHLLQLWNSFHELSTERSVGMGAGPIPLSKVREYLREELEIDDEEEYEHAYMVLKRLDSEYASLANKTEKEKADQQRTPTSRSPKPLSPKASDGKRGKRSR